MTVPDVPDPDVPDPDVRDTDRRDAGAVDEGAVMLLRRTFAVVADSTDVTRPPWPLPERAIQLPDPYVVSTRLPTRRPNRSWLAAAAVIALVVGVIGVWRLRADDRSPVVVAGPPAESAFRPWLDPEWIPFDVAHTSSFQSAAPPQFRADVRDADGRWATLRWTSQADTGRAGIGPRPPDFEDAPVGAKGRPGDVDFYAWAAPTPPDPAHLAANAVALPPASMDLLLALVSDLSQRCGSTDCAGYDPAAGDDPLLDGVTLVRRGPDDRALQTLRTWRNASGSSSLSVIAHADGDTLRLASVSPVPGLSPTLADDEEARSERFKLDGHRALFMSDSQRATLIVERRDLGSTIVISGWTDDEVGLTTDDRVAINAEFRDAGGEAHPQFAFGRPTLERIAMSLEQRPGTEFEAEVRDEYGSVVDDGVTVAGGTREFGWSAIAGEISYPTSVCAVRVVVLPIAPGSFGTGADPCATGPEGDRAGPSFDVRSAPDGTLVAVAIGDASMTSLRFEFDDGVVDTMLTVPIGDGSVRVAVAGVRLADVTLSLVDATGMTTGPTASYRYEVGGGA